MAVAVAVAVAGTQGLGVCQAARGCAVFAVFAHKLAMYLSPCEKAGKKCVQGAARQPRSIVTLGCSESAHA